MNYSNVIWPNAAQYILRSGSTKPTMFFCAETLRSTVREYLDGFPGTVTYAVKANPSDTVLQNLVASGIGAFDVASVAEIQAISRLAPGATMHFNNPVRSKAEIFEAAAFGVTSYSVDSFSEFNKLAKIVPNEGAEISVRFKLPVKGAAYDFGAKFGAMPETAGKLLSAVSKAGYRASLTFHPGTQCLRPQAWTSYIEAAAKIAAEAKVDLYRLNTGGGFPAQRKKGQVDTLSSIFAAIEQATNKNFGAQRPMLLCEPGRGLVAECFTYCVSVRAVRDDGAIFLNDGIYGALSELQVMGATDRVRVLQPDGAPRLGPVHQAPIFGPTCDSLDQLPEGLSLPQNIAEGDRLLFSGMGAYSLTLATAFNGFGEVDIVNLASFT